MAFNSVKRGSDLGAVTLTKKRGDSHINNDATFTGPQRRCYLKYVLLVTCDGTFITPNYPSE